MRHRLPDPAPYCPLPLMERICVCLPPWISDPSGEDGPTTDTGLASECPVTAKGAHMGGILHTCRFGVAVGVAVLFCPNL